MTTGRDLRDHGWQNVQAADTAIHRDHRVAIEAALDTLISEGQPFTAETLRARLSQDVRPHSANLLPSVMGHAARDRRMVPIGWDRTTRPSRHYSRLTIWIGSQHVEAGAA